MGLKGSGGLKRWPLPPSVRFDAYRLFIAVVLLAVGRWPRGTRGWLDAPRVCAASIRRASSHVWVHHSSEPDQRASELVP